jgi:hypothetical protein
MKALQPNPEPFMTSTIQNTLAAAALAASALASPQAQALAFQMQTSGTSQVIEIINTQGPVLRFATQTEGTGSLGLTGYLSTDVINMATGQGSGTNRFVAPNGDELRGSFTVQVLPGATPGALSVQGLTLFEGGTGIFDGATGSASFVGTGQFVSDTRALVSFEHTGQLSMVPEPATGALLLGGLAAVAGGVRRQRQA